MTLVLHGPSYNPALPVITPEALATSINNEFTAFWLPLAGGVVSGPLSAPTPAPGDNSTRVATTAFVGSAVTTAGAAYLPISGGSMAGPLTYTATGGTVARSAQDRAADVANVLDFGADPTGVADSTSAFNAALARRRGGRPVDVFAPAGVYRLRSSIQVGDATYSQRLFGDGWSTVLSVGPDFSASANGVIVTAAGNLVLAQASITDLQIFFQQPPDISTTATASTAIGSTAITLASVTGIQVGYYCRDITDANALPTQSTMPKVVSIAGNVVTLDRTAIHVIGVGHVMQFAANRSMAVPLSSAPTLTPGAPAIQYPWAIYAVSQSVFIDHVVVGGGWNGVYIRGQTFIIGQYLAGCLNIGLDIDQCFNFPKVDHYQFWGFGFLTASAAMFGIYYDGQTVAANIGRCDDFTADVIQSWCGIVNFTSTWSWGQINQLKLDGDNSALNVLGGSWVQLGEVYKTGGQNQIGLPLVISGATRVDIDSLVMSTAQAGSSITVSNGALTIGKGYLWNGQIGTNPMISVTGGAVSLTQMRFDGSVGRTQTYLTQTGGSVRVSDSVFIIAPGAGGRAFSLTDNVMNAIVDVEQNGWGFTPPGTLGRYETRDTLGVTHVNTGTGFAAVDTPTSAQVTVRPPGTGPAAAEGKLRFFGSFFSGADVAPRMAASIRAGHASAGWAAPYMDFWLGNGGSNDTASDANTVRTLSMRSNAGNLTTILGFDAAVANIFALNGVAASGRRLQWMTASVPRWGITPANSEGGTNTGADLRFDAYTDAGVLLSSPILITRSTGNVLLSGGMSMGAQTGASNVDLSKHVQLHTSGYGMSVTGGRLNVVAPAAAGVFLSVAGADILVVGAGGATVTGGLTAGAFRVGGNQIVGARVTGWGVATGGSKAALTAGTATLAQTAAAVAQLIADLTTHGLIGA